jgi:serine/threonine protein kinase
MFSLLGTPTEKNWPGFLNLPTVRKVLFGMLADVFRRLLTLLQVQFRHIPGSSLRREFSYLTEQAYSLLSRLLTFDPAQRITAAEVCHGALFVFVLQKFVRVRPCGTHIFPKPRPRHHPISFHTGRPSPKETGCAPKLGAF